ncbi:uncharacterized protein SAPINGB_P003481 [Magnusiomyces paraingens]|uniref:Uncharacterized protein n=1 Tax=Magnusiomyces paraingens TaxID=2606893 RepID=A0A5E8BX15_9ASCO|nr:uncharacterized protein SAPINGB_P003481 [Saprochaete ingens]VVT53255.1 unnamed protein product [Saprochaete ingens]
MASHTNLHQEGTGPSQATIVPMVLNNPPPRAFQETSVRPISSNYPSHISNSRFVIHSNQIPSLPQGPVTPFYLNPAFAQQNTAPEHTLQAIHAINEHNPGVATTVLNSAPTVLEAQFNSTTMFASPSQRHMHSNSLLSNTHDPHNSSFSSNPLSHHHIQNGSIHHHSQPSSIHNNHFDHSSIMIQHELTNTTDKSSEISYAINKGSPEFLSSPLLTDTTSPNASSSDNNGSTEIKNEITSISNPSVALSNFKKVSEQPLQAANPKLVLVSTPQRALGQPPKLTKKNSVKAPSPTKRRRANTNAIKDLIFPSSPDKALPTTEVRVVRLDEKDSEIEVLFHHQLSSGQATRPVNVSIVPLERTQIKDKSVTMEEYFLREADLRDLRECSRRVPYRNYFSLLNETIQNSRSQRMTKSLVKSSNFITRKQRSWIEQKIEQSLSNIIEQSGYLALINLFGTGLRKVYFCPRFCLAFTGNFKSYTICPCCKSPKEDTVFGWYISPISQIAELMKDPELAQIITHPHEPDPDYIRDVWDGDLCSKTLPSRGFVRYDEDGQRIFELVFGASATSGNIWSSKCFEFIDINLHLFNLPKNERNNVKYMFPVFSYPKKSDDTQPPNHFTFFQPLVDDLNLLNKGFICYNAHLREYVKMTCSLAFYFGDYPLPNDAFNISTHSAIKGENADFSGSFDSSATTFTQYPKDEHFLVGTPPPTDHDFISSSIDPGNLNGINGMSNSSTSLSFAQQYNLSGPSPTKDSISENTVPLPTLCSPESFPFEIIQFSFKDITTFIFTSIIGSSDNRMKAKKAVTKEGFPPSFRINDAGRTILKNILKSANLNFSQSWLGITFDIDEILGGRLNDLTYTELRGLLELFPVFCKELEGSGNDNIMRIFLCISLIIRVTYMSAVPRSFLDEIESTIISIVEDLKKEATESYPDFYDTECRFKLDALLKIIYYIKNTGNLRSFWSWLTDGSIKELKESSKATRFYISALANTKLRKWHLNLILNKPSPVTFGAHKLKALQSSSFVPTASYAEDSGGEDEDEYEDSKEQISQTDCLSFISQAHSFTAWRRFKVCKLQSNGMKICVGTYARISNAENDNATFTNYAKVFDLVQLTVPTLVLNGQSPNNTPLPSNISRSKQKSSFSSTTGYTSKIEEYAIIKYCQTSKMEAVKDHNYFPFTKDGMTFMNYMIDGIHLESNFTLIPVAQLANPVHLLPLQKRDSTVRYFVDPYIFGRYNTSTTYNRKPTEQVFELSTYDAETEINKDLRQYHVNNRNKNKVSARDVQSIYEHFISKGEDTIIDEAMRSYTQRAHLWKPFESSFDA